MTVRYHLSPETGNANKCSAAEGRCPFGADLPHFASKDEAREAYEAGRGGSFDSGDKQDENKAKEASKASMEDLAATHVKHHSWASYPKGPTGAQVRAAVAYAKLNNVYAAVGYEEIKHSQGFTLELDYDHTGYDAVSLESRTYIVATPTGELVRASYETGIVAEYDDKWEYRPDLRANYETYASARALAGGRSEAKGEVDLFTDSDEALRIYDGGGSSWPSYSQADEADTRRAAQRLMEKLADPHSMAKLARLRHSGKRIGPKVLESDSYLKSPRPFVREALAGRKELPRALQAPLATDSDVRVRYELAKRPDLSAAVVKELLTQSHSWNDRGLRSTVRHRLLANPGLSAAVQRREAKAGNLEDLKALARNGKLDSDARATILKRTEGLGVRLDWGKAFEG